MLRTKLTIAILCGGLAAPAAAADPAYGIPNGSLSTVAGYVGVYGGIVRFTNLDPAITFDGAVAVTRGTFNIEIEPRGLLFFDADPALFSAAMIHAYWRNARAAFGLFGGPEFISTGGGPPVLAWHLGGEAQFYLDAITFYTQAAVVSAGGTNIWYARAALRHFPRDNVRLETGIRAVVGSGDFVVTVIGEGEFRIPNSPVSTVATFRYMQEVGGTINSFTALFGLRVNFGYGDLIDQNAPMNTLPLLF